jgi:endonuclease YncB( thermonuclease family)
MLDRFAAAIALAAAVYVIDGDTIRFRGETIRIENIDAPEMPMHAKCQAEAKLALVAKARMAQLTDGRTPVLQRHGLDRYGRTLARVSVDGVDVGEELVAENLAVPWGGHRARWCVG